jgi:hypothetical protein
LFLSRQRNQSPKKFPPPRAFWPSDPAVSISIIRESKQSGFFRTNLRQSRDGGTGIVRVALLGAIQDASNNAFRVFLLEAIPMLAAALYSAKGSSISQSDYLPLHFVQTHPGFPRKARQFSIRV